jgi:hypothetical protein
MTVTPTIPRDRISTDEFRGLDRLDRAELDEEEGDLPPSDWDDTSAVRKLASLPPPAGSTVESSQARVA